MLSDVFVFSLCLCSLFTIHDSLFLSTLKNRHHIGSKTINNVRQVVLQWNGIREYLKQILECDLVPWIILTLI